MATASKPLSLDPVERPTLLRIGCLRCTQDAGYGNPSDFQLACALPAGYVTAAGDCNDGSAGAYPGAEEICDGLDNDCDGFADNLAAPAAVTSLVETKNGAVSELSWAAVSGATGYDVVKGSLGSLRSTGGDFGAATTGCLADDTATTTATDSDPLGVGEGFWHLVRASNCGVPGTYDESAPSQRGSRDLEIDSSPVACP